MTTIDDPVFAVVTGGGTAGHVLPALAIAEGLVDAGHRPESIHYIGARRGIETRLLPPTPFPHHFLDITGLQRSWRRWRSNAALPARLAGATRAAGRLLDEHRPQVVVSVGGYASAPAVLAARRRRIPVVVVSYDRSPGLASRLTARFAAVSAVAFDDSPLPRAIVTGAPVRRVMRELDRDAMRSSARRELGLPADRFVVGVTGGSQGSGVLNDAIAAYAAEHRDDAGLAIRQIVGERFLGATPPAEAGPAGLIHQVIGYDDHLERTYAAIDVLVGRGGASTVAEVAVTGTPAILVPWRDAADDHQTRNVAWLADDGAAVALAETDVTRLGAELDGLRSDPGARRALGARARRLGEMHRGDRLARVIEDVAAGVRPSR
ncbi:MAG: UDP-N-acetylglucosamine--N-acetylmuramyl-(pentapeptide) pyrophosphoryl-undecaprenol N-acetylglucosamine transferase [Desertimonas sp.]